MKVDYALINVRHPSEGRSIFKAPADDMSFEGGLLTIKTVKGKTLVTPTANIAWMEPAEKAAKK